MVEGNKIIRELEESAYRITEIFSVEPDSIKNDQVLVTLIDERELKKISFLQHPKDSVAICQIPGNMQFEESNLQLILDGIQDPGNLGTIIRLADWFGIKNLICSEDTADLYNPKVIQASMGSFTRVNLFYTQIDHFLTESANLNIGTDMVGENIYQFEFPDKLNLVLGNEGNGMRPSTVDLLHHKVCIPRFGPSQSTESLNVSVAASIILGQKFAVKQKKTVSN